MSTANTPTTEGTDTTALLEVRDLEVAFRSSTGLVPAVRKANLTLYPGQSVAIVGESGSGKSTLASAVIGLLPGTGRVTGGTITFNGTDITHASAREYQALRGSEIGLVPQDPMSNLNPVWSIGFQVKEALKANGLAGVADDRLAALAAAEKGEEVSAGGRIDVDEQVALLLEEAGLPDAARRARQYPHEFSGGMRQRALIAIGLAARPQLLIADEPTSALDVTVQRRILDHLGEQIHSLGTAMLFITHDLGLAAERAEHIVVMHRGRVVESGPSIEVLQDPRHPYTQRLVQAAPSLASRRIQTAHAAGIQVSEDELGVREIADDVDEVLRTEHLTKVFDVRGAKGEAKTLKAVDDVTFGVRRGTTTALVGESGSGKSTVANIILNLLDPTSGKVFHNGVDLSTLGDKELFALRRIMQPVFQNPYGSLDPMYSIFRVIEEPLRVHHVGTRQERETRVAELLDLVSLPRSVMRRYPNELSGGQRQRVAIARALALRPEIIVLDEAVSALDVLVQAQVLRLLTDLQTELGLTYLFITHDLAVVRQIADDVVVMEHGRVVEAGPSDDLFDNPRQEYTRELINAVPGASIPLYGA
ncbi:MULTISPECIES: ABC transporter ATP-binding protein [unclassified Actinomyces]|uniref:dipeptide ABC transporter ATP-binding protein n=1 Tax=unclassified Actinomyces TaxID=2609248 RepID=UPI00201835CF|nr:MULTISPECIES: ABC transporter ATP-binding protein [unclassified Actinomyces]MCL3776894.1 ABC transporter ATP-binding protein [Actinomyces sp. AC-20-1]MCL3790532.1 ABC transporter ATP-binding protein [Actinomyces sp. 187325]MCL3794202.1 ABC transporter ATP-binding protein [Actinomyces sp. 217892]